MSAQATFSLDAIDAALAAAGHSPDPDEQRLAAAVLRLLSAGEPVSIPAAAAEARIPGPRAEAGAAVLARRVLGRSRPDHGVLGPGAG